MRFSSWAIGRAYAERANNRRNARAHGRCGRALAVEMLENRHLLSATVASLGTATDYSRFNANVAVTAGAAVAAGNTLIVEIAADPTAGQVTVSDDRGNVYTKDVSIINTKRVEIWVFSAPVANSLSAGDQIVANFAGSPPNAKAVSVLSVAGLAQSASLDAKQAAVGANLFPNSGLTPTTHHPEELLVGAIGVEGPITGGFTAGSGYTALGRAGTNQGAENSNVTINPEYRTVSALGQYAANATIPAENKWAAAIATYAIATAPVLEQPSDQTNAEGDAANLQIVASDSDGDPITYSQTGLPPGLSIDASTGLITGTVHTTFANHGPYSVSVTAADPGGLSDTKTFTWTVNNVAPTAVNQAYAVSLNTTLNLSAPGVLAGSNDPGEEALEAVLNTGVGHGSLTLNSDGSFSYTPTTGYTGLDSFTFHAFDGAASGNVATVTLQVGDVTPPVVTPTPNQTNNENASVSLQIVATDPDNPTLFYSAASLPDGLSIDSGTGLISGTIAGTAADQAPFNVDVSVSDGSNTVHDLFLWTVNNVAPVAAGNNLSLTEGISSGNVTVASFTDAGGPEPLANYSATIDWGDGTITAGTISLSGGTFTVQGSHVYAEESSPKHSGGLGYYPVTASIVDNNMFSTLTSTATGQAFVSDPAVTPTGGFTLTATAGVNSGLQTLAAFTDPGGAEPLADYSATIDWGDATSSAGTISVSGGTYTVQASHTYALPSDPGSPYVLTVAIAHENAPLAFAISAGNVADGPIAANALPLNGFEFSSLTNVPVATFTHNLNTQPPEDFAATINWGDGTTSAGTASFSGSLYTVSGSHTYTDERVWPTTVAIHDTHPGVTTSATASSTATMLEELLPGGVQGTPNERFISEVYRDLLGRPVDPAGLAQWNALLSAGESRELIVQQIEATPEFANDTAERLYQRYLHRDGADGGVTFFASFLLHGSTTEQVSAVMAGSNEFFITQGGGTNNGFLSALYLDALGRPIDPAGLAQWTSLLNAGFSRTEVASMVLASQEYRQDLVSEAYLQLLDRPVDPGGLNVWLSALNSGATDQFVYAGICASPEYYNKTVA